MGKPDFPTFPPGATTVEVGSFRIDHVGLRPKRVKTPTGFAVFSPASSAVKVDDGWRQAEVALGRMNNSPAILSEDFELASFV